MNKQIYRLKLNKYSSTTIKWKNMQKMTLTIFVRHQYSELFPRIMI